MKRLIILQTVLPDYRRKLFFAIKKDLGSLFGLYGGEYYFERTVITDKSIEYTTVNNIYLFNRKFLFQTGKIWSQVLKDNIIVMEMNPRIISNWIILILRRFFFRKSVLWGHAWPRNGSESKSDYIRNIMRKLSNEVVVYTKSQEAELKIKMPNKVIRTAPNSLFYKKEMVASCNTKQISNFIYVGRLTKIKKPIFLVKAFHETIKEIPNNYNLILVGEGEERPIIEEYISKNNIKNRVKILGHIGNYNELKELYSNSLASISPGYVGLSITQSLGFGVPMIISKDENHSPELEAAIEGENSLFFKTDSISSIKSAMKTMIKDQEFWVKNRVKISTDCKKNYSIEVMSNAFISLVR